MKNTLKKVVAVIICLTMLCGVASVGAADFSVIKALAGTNKLSSYISSLTVSDTISVEGRDSYIAQNGGVEWTEFNYNPEVTVVLKNGVDFTGDIFDVSWWIEDITGFFSYYEYTDDQSVYTPWGIGDHTATLIFDDIKADFTVTVLPDPVKELVEDIEVTYTGKHVEGLTGCTMVTEYFDEVSEEYLEREYYGYGINIGEVLIKFNYKDGSSFSGDIDEVAEDFAERTGGDCFTWNLCENQSYDNLWTIGTNYATIEFNSVKVDFAVEVLENPLKDLIEDITFIGVNPLYKGINSSVTTDFVWDDELGENVEITFDYYEVSSYDILVKVDYKDGTEFSGTLSDVRDKIEDIAGVYPECDIRTNQYGEEPWDIGNHTVTLEFLGKTYELSVEVKENPLDNLIKDVSVEYVGTMYEGLSADMMYDEIEDEETGEYTEVYYPCYSFIPEDVLVTVNFKDGTSFTGNPYVVQEELIEKIGVYIRCELNYNQSYDDQWTLGENKAYVEYGDVKYEFTVNLLPNPLTESVKSISVKYDGKLFEGIGLSEYDDNYYIDDEKVLVTIKFADGKTITGSVMEVVLSLVDLYDEVPSYKITPEDNGGVPWEVGTHKATLFIGGLTCEFDVELAENPVESISAKYTKELIEKADMLIESDSYWDENDDVVEYYYSVYPITKDYVELTVKLKDGTTVKGVYDDVVAEIERKTGIEADYYPEFSSDQSSDTVWEIGEHPFEFYLYGQTVEGKVKIVASPVEKITVSNIKKRTAGEEDWNISFDFSVKFKDGSVKSYVYGAAASYDGYSVTHSYNEDEALVFSYMGYDFIANAPIENSAKDGSPFVYIQQDGKAYITDYIGSATTVVIPEKIDGITVAGVQDLALASGRNVAIKSLIIPDSVVLFSADAASRLSDLKTITIGAGVKNLTEGIFSDLNNLESITVSENNANYSSADGILYTKDGTSLLCVPAAVNYEGASFIEEDGVTYDKTKTAVIFCDTDKDGAYVMPESVKVIADNAFSECRNLTSVTIADGVTEISYGAFAYCTSLGNVTIPASVKTVDNYAFCDAGLKEVKLPGVEKIGEYAFATSIFVYSQLATVEFSDNLKEIERSAFSNSAIKELNVPSSVKTIGASAFDLCSQLESVNFSEGLETIGDVAFFGCTSLKEVTLPNSLKNAGELVFSFCTNLEKVTFGTGLSPVPAFFVSNSDKLTTVNIPSSVELSQYAIYECPKYLKAPDGMSYCSDNSYLSADGKTIYIKNAANVTEIAYREFATTTTAAVIDSIPVNIKTVRPNAFNEAYLTEKDGGKYVHDVLVTISSDLKDGKFTTAKGTRIIADYAGGRNKALKEVTLTEGIEAIPLLAFFNAENLEKITIPASVKTIDSLAFVGTDIKEIVVSKDNNNFVFKDGVLYTKDMKEIVYVSKAVKGEFTVPSTVTTIRDSAFANCTELNKVVIGKNVKTIGDYNFATAVSDYKTQYFIENDILVTTATQSPVIYVVKGSAAYKYAVSQGVPYNFSESAGESTLIETENAKQADDGLVYAVTDATVEEILAALPGATITDKNGNAVTDGKLKNGCVITKADGTQTTVIVLGDVDCDGEVKAADARLALRKAVGLESFGEESVEYAAANIEDMSTGEVTAADARMILRASVGLEDVKSLLNEIG